MTGVFDFLSCAAGVRRRDGAHAEPAPERRRGVWKRSGPLRGVCLSQWEALPLQGRGHLYLQREPEVLDKTLATELITTSMKYPKASLLKGKKHNSLYLPKLMLQQRSFSSK